jgi:hypothetical protein
MALAPVLTQALTLMQALAVTLTLTRALTPAPAALDWRPAGQRDSTTTLPMVGQNYSLPLHYLSVTKTQSRACPTFATLTAHAMIFVQTQQVFTQITSCVRKSSQHEIAKDNTKTRRLGKSMSRPRWLALVSWAVLAMANLES